MKKILLFVILVAVIYFLFFYRGSTKLTSKRAEEIFAIDIEPISKEIIRHETGFVSDKHLQWIDENIEGMKDSFELKNFKREKEYYIAEMEIKIVDETTTIDIRYGRYEDGWKIDEIKMPDGNWISVQTVIHPDKAGQDPASLLRRIKATMELLEKVGLAIEAYIADRHCAPQVGSFTELKKVLQPTYILQLPSKDAWGNDFYYWHGSGLNDYFYAVGSAGSDGIFEGFEQKGNYTDYSGKDIIYSDSKFTFYPKPE